MTLDELERPKRTLEEKNRFTEPTRKIWMKIDPYCQRQNCRLTILVSRNISLLEYSQAFPLQGAPNDSVVPENGDAQIFPSKFLTTKPTLLYTNT